MSQRPAPIALDQPEGDVWAWNKRISGTCPYCPSEAAINILVNGMSILAERDGKAFTADIPLHPGENEVIAVATLPESAAEYSAPVVYSVPLQPRPTARLAVRVAELRLLFDATDSEPSDYDNAAITSWNLSLPEALSGTIETRGEGAWVVPLPATDGQYVASLTVTDDKGRSDTTRVALVVGNGEVRVPDPVHERAAWIADAVVYGVVPMFFDPPGFQGVTARLDDLADLGVSALWFSPITRTLPGDFGYAVTDYFDLRPEYGTKDDFKDLVTAAHARGLRVLMDFVPNHTSAEHPYFRDVVAHGEASAYWDFYDRDAGGNPTHYFDWSHLPNLNYDNPEVQRFMLEAFSYWVREFDVDGFRVDAVWGIKERNPEWLDSFLAEMNRLKPDSLLIAEASARDAFYFDAGFDAAYDWTDELGHWAWGEALGGVAPLGEAMIDVLTDSGRRYHEDALVMRFLNNNDTGARFLTSFGVDFYRVALAMLMTLPGLPCLYTGDEVGAEYQPYEQDGIGAIDWTDHHDLRAYTRKLITLRRETPALHSPTWTPLAVEPAAPFFAYLRQADGAKPVVVLLNFSAAEQQATITLPDAAANAFAGPLVDLWNDESLPEFASNPLRLGVPRWGIRIVTHG